MTRKIKLRELSETLPKGRVWKLSETLPKGRVWKLSETLPKGRVSGSYISRSCFFVPKLNDEVYK
ncbi:hypothetical protein [Leptospira santarosai]|uniref:hypothetical protein n=1 Tax=Leptospira santarosai TaxID=28183 RepID=UPI0024AF8D84|nr:hypothetical protein [Leptospira santarosai]MDI7165553.1 hypothetical protein [Leptospira santarosai]